MSTATIHTLSAGRRKSGRIYAQQIAKAWHTLDAEAHEAAAQALIAQGYTRHTARHIYREEFRKAGQPTQVLGRPLGSLEWTPRTLEVIP